MSYARFGWEGSDVYVILNAGGYLNCCGCALDVPQHHSTASMLRHLFDHLRAGHTVPADCIEGLKAAAAENDAWIAGFPYPGSRP